MSTTEHREAMLEHLSSQINAELTAPEPLPEAKVPDVGIHPGTSFIEYQQWDAVSHHLLEGYKRTPAHARELMVNPKPSTRAMSLGHAFHALLLEPERFAEEFTEVPRNAPKEKRRKADKEWWANFYAENAHRIILKSDELRAFRLMARNVLEQPVAQELLAHGRSEISFAWDDEETGLRCKGRADHVGPLASETYVVDVKTGEDVGLRSFQRSVATLGYHRQGSWYRHGLNVLSPRPRRVAFICVETVAPYCVAVYELDERALEQGEREWRKHLQEHKRCQETGLYPGYDEGMDIIDLPAWAVDSMDQGG